MKTIKKQVEEKLNAEFSGHPSRQEEHDIKLLKEIVIKLAEQIDILTMYKKDA
jgi:hypothetical protein